MQPPVDYIAPSPQQTLTPQRPEPAAARRGLALLLVVCLLAGALQAVYWTGVVGSDDLAYLKVAEQARDGTLKFPPAEHFQARPMVWKPLQGLASVLPGNSLTLALPSLMAGWVVLFTVAQLGRRWGGGTGWLAMGLLALVPVNVVIASTLLPDVIGSALAWVGVALAMRPMLERDCRGALARCAAAGVAMAAGYNAKEPVVFFIPGVFLYILLSCPRQGWAWTRGLALGCGAAIWMAGEMLWLWRAAGDPLFHVHAVRVSQECFFTLPIEHTARGLLRYWTEYLRWFALPTSDFGPVGPILLAGVIVALAVRTPWMKLLLCTVAPAAVYLSVGSTDWNRYQPIIHQSRYFLPVVPAMALVTAAVIGENWRRHPRWRPAMSLAGVVLVLASLIAPDRIAGKWYHAQTFSAGQQVLRECASGERKRLCASDLTASRFAALVRWFGLPQIEVIEEPPRTREEWSARYAGADILVSRLDRVRPIDKHLCRSLYGSSLAGLNEFPRVAKAVPAASRLAAVWAWCTGRIAPGVEDFAVETRRIPATATGSAASR